jgi:hypothetical protein
VLNTRLLALRLTKPVPPPATKPEEPPAEAYRQDLAAYEAALKKCGLEEKSLPAVVFLAPDGSALSKLVQPQEESALIAAIRAVPPLLAKWIADQRKNEPPPPPSAGTRPPEEYPR